MDRPASACPFLDLPVELRLHIYSFAVLDTRHITIGTAKLEGCHADIIHRLYADQRTPFPGIPVHHEPVVDPAYTAALLSPTKSAHIHLTPATLDPPDDAYAHTHTAYHILSLLCKQVACELKSHFAIPARRQTSLFVQYPHGLHILHTLTPQLLRQSRSVHLAGKYVPTDFSPARAARRLRHTGVAPIPAKLQGSSTPDAAGELGDLIKGMFGPDPKNPVDKLEMRIYYPGDDSYSTVWGDDNSPTVVALRNVQWGEIGIEIWRGRHGTGVYITAKPTTEKKRVVSTVWRKLEEGRRGEPAIGSWVVDPTWPEWQTEYQPSEGPRGDVITSVSS